MNQKKLQDQWKITLSLIMYSDYLKSAKWEHVRFIFLDFLILFIRTATIVHQLQLHFLETIETDSDFILNTNAKGRIEINSRS